jgi:hypothetical protein
MTTTFDLLMSHGGFDTFALVVNYIYNNWEVCNITMSIFKVHETLGTTMVLQLKDLFVRFDLCEKIITYVKDEGVDLNTFKISWTTLFHVFHYCWQNHILLVVMGMQCQIVASIPLMIRKCVLK